MAPILFLNDAATAMYGYSAEEALGKNIELVIPIERRDEEMQIRANITAGERIDHTETLRRATRTAV